jgi:hypothetical protein
MAVYPYEPRGGNEDRVPVPEEARLFARIEGLVGEEDALLTIPAKQRSAAQRSRLAEIGHELDRIFEKLRDRADRAAERAAGGI